MSRFVDFLASRRLTAGLLVVTGLISAAGSLLPSSSAATLFGSVFFTALGALLFANMLAGLAVGFRRDTEGFGIQLVRMGALAVLLGAFIGMYAGERGYAQIYEGDTTGAFTSPAGARINPGFSLRLDRFIVERYPAGAMELGISAGSGAGMRLYPVSIGVEAGPEDFRVLPLRYVPDFLIATDGSITSRSSSPNNPALEVEVTAAGETERGWLFARFPHFPPPGLRRTLRAGRVHFYDRRSEKVKTYKSEVTVIRGGSPAENGTIEVNRPLRLNGYRIYQAEYDPVGFQWSGFELVRDPGLPIVYGGFILLAAGVTVWAGFNSFGGSRNA